MKTVLEMWNCFASLPQHLHAASVEIALRDFRALPLVQQDKFCGLLADSTRKITDLTTAQLFMRARNAK